VCREPGLGSPVHRSSRGFCQRGHARGSPCAVTGPEFQPVCLALRYPAIRTAPLKQWVGSESMRGREGEK
jgi:hypothetical protein